MLTSGMLSFQDVTSMALFAEVVERGSFTAAADAAGMGKATVSRRIAALEKQVGVQLLRRTTRQVLPTEEGQRLYRECARVVAAAREATEALHATGGRPRGVLRVDAPIVFAQLHLAEAATEFLLENPEVDLRLWSRSEVTDLVREKIDVGVRIGRPKDSSLVVRKLVTDRVVATASPAYLARRGTPRRPADLSEHALLRYSWSAERRQWSSDRAPDGPPDPTQVNFLASDPALVREAAVHGLGISILPSFIVKPAVDEGRLVHLMKTAKLRDVSLYLVYPGRRNLPVRVRAFIDFLVERFTSPRWKRRALL